MAWIESHQALKDHPKTLDFMEMLNIKLPEAIGHLHLLWWWCVDYAPTGQIKASDAAIARAAVWSGDAKVFVEALIKVRFLDRLDGVLAVHDWLDFCGDLIKKRIEYKEVKDKRIGNIRDSLRILGDSQRKSENREPTKPNQTKPNQTNPDNIIPPPLELLKKYIQENGLCVDADKWFDFYDSKGWMIGKNKMKNWKAAVRTWDKNPDGSFFKKDQIKSKLEQNLSQIPFGGGIAK
jgi:hypothetical protein